MLAHVSVLDIRDDLAESLCELNYVNEILLRSLKILKDFAFPQLAFQLLNCVWLQGLEDPTDQILNGSFLCNDL